MWHLHFAKCKTAVVVLPTTAYYHMTTAHLELFTITLLYLAYLCICAYSCRSNSLVVNSQVKDGFLVA